MFRWFIFLFCSLALAACSAQNVSPAVTKIAITPSSVPTETAGATAITASPLIVRSFLLTFYYEALLVFCTWVILLLRCVYNFGDEIRNHL